MTKIVVIDDDRPLVELMFEVIMENVSSVELYSAHTGNEGCEIIRDTSPDLIILDAVLPEMDGFMLCEKIKKDAGLWHIPVLMITGRGSQVDTKVKSLNIGAEAFIKKPFQIGEFIAQVRSMIRLKKAEDRLRKQRDRLRVDVGNKEKELADNYEDLKELFKSFIEVMATTIDSLSIYDYDNSQRVAMMVARFVEYLNKSGAYHGITFDEEESENLITAAWLHDIGKILIPVNLLNKTTRLGDAYPVLRQRLETIFYWIKATGVDLMDEYIFVREYIEKYNNPVTALHDESMEKLRKVACLKYQNAEGKEQNWLTAYEVQCLTVKEGTLTEEEKKQVREHVKMTDLLLAKLHLPAGKQKIRRWCADHHELLDGSGYWKGAAGDEIHVETRILTIVDIFEALTSEDRNYKTTYSIPDALEFLKSMAKTGKLDKLMVKSFVESEAWKI